MYLYHHMTEAGCDYEGVGGLLGTHIAVLARAVVEERDEELGTEALKRDFRSRLSLGSYPLLSVSTWMKTWTRISPPIRLAEKRPSLSGIV
jgi:hypothetical protein